MTEKSTRFCCAWALLVSMLVTVAAGAPCPPDWEQWGGMCYLLNSSSTLSRAGADALCRERAASLVNITTISKNLGVVDILRDKSVQQWWTGMRHGPKDLAGLLDHFGEEKVEPDPEHQQCVYISSLDGYWYQAACDSVMHYICEREAQTVSVELVSPDNARPSAAWFATHAKNVEDDLYAQRANSLMDDDKGVFNAEKVTMTPKPPVTSPMPTAAPPATTTEAVATTTVSLCQDRNWLMLDVSCYQLMMNARNWTAASDYCHQQGGELAAFRNRQVQQTFLSHFGHNTGSVWIGLQRRGAAWAMTWLDGATLDYTAWAPGFPDHGGRSTGCVALALHTGVWTEEHCTAYKPFICQRSLGATSMAPPATTPTTSPSLRCGGAGWWEYRQSCYLLVTEPPPVSWHAAQQGCRERSANLAKIDSIAENSNIFNRVTQSNLPVWIGLSRLRPPHNYAWVDGTQATFTQWEHGTNPSADMVGCARMDNEHGSWRAVNCNSPQYYVCQKPLGGAAPPPPPPPPAPGSVCPDGWAPYGAGQCLQVSDRLLSWSEARRTCRTKASGGELASIADPVHQAFMTSAIQESRVATWIGLTTIQVEQKFLTWTDQSAVNYTNWAPGQPSSKCDTCPLTCGLMSSGRSQTPGAWSAVDCSHAFGFVCQRPAATNASGTVPGQSGELQPYCPPPHGEFVADGDACLKVERRPATWHDAVASCRRQNSSLAYVADIFDNAQLVKLLYKDGGDQYWLGLSETARFGSMQWTSPWPAEPSYTAWEPGWAAPATPASCAALRPSTAWWRHLSCADPQPYVCMYSPQREAARMALAKCPSGGWTASRTRCYRLQESVFNTRTWPEAKRACEEDGYQLAVISSEDDFLAVMEAVSGLTSTYSAWIGLKRMSNGSFAWVDGSAAEFNGWQPSEPSALQETCVEASKLNSGRWNDLGCNLYRPYVCMAEVNRPSSPSASASRTSAAGGGGGGAGWRAFGVACLVAALAAALVGAAVWAVRRSRRGRPRHQRLSVDRPPAHHGLDNPVYDEETRLPVDASLAENGGDGLNRWQGASEPLEEHPL